MAITPEEARQELERRGALPSQQSAISITPEEARQELKRRGVLPSQSQTETQPEPISSSFTKQQQMGYPEEVGRDVVVGAAELGRGQSNSPWRIGDQLQDLVTSYLVPKDKQKAYKEITPSMSDVIMGERPVSEERDYSAAYGIPNPNIPDKIIQGAIELSPFWPAIWKGAKGLGRAAKGNVFDRLITPKKEANQLEKLEGYLERINETKEKAQDAYTKAQDLSQIETGARTPASLERQILQSEDMLPQLQERAAQEQSFNKQVQEVSSETNKLRPEIERLQNLESKLGNEAADIESKIFEHTYNKKEPDTVFSRHLVEDLESKYKEPASNIYDEVKENFKKSDYVVPKNTGIDLMLNQLDSVISEGGYGSRATMELGKKIKSTLAKPEVTADDLYSIFRTSRKAATEVNKNAYKPGINDAAHDRYVNKAAEIEDFASLFEPMLEDVPVGKDALDKLKAANSLWRKVKEVEDNSLFKSAKRHGRVEGNILKKMRGTEAGSDVLNTLVAENPELIKSAFGASHGGKLQNYLSSLSEREQALISNEPELYNMIQNYMGSINKQQNLRPRIEEAQTNFNQLSKLGEQLLKEKQSRAGSQTKLEDFIKQNQAQEKNLKRLELRRDRLQSIKSKPKAVEKQIKDLEKKIDSIKESRKLGLYGLGAAGGAGLGAFGIKKLSDIFKD